MNDLATLAGLPRTVKLGARSYRLWPLTLRDLGRFQAWLDEQSIVAESIRGAVDLLPPGPAGYLKRLARAKTRTYFGSAAAEALAGSMLGQIELLYLAIRRGRRRFRRADAAELYWALDDDAFEALRWCVCGDDLPTGDAGESADPTAGINAWALYWRLSNDPYRFAPDQVSRMTIPQVRCVLSDGKPFGQHRIANIVEYEAFMARRAADPWHQ